MWAGKPVKYSRPGSGARGSGLQGGDAVWGQFGRWLGNADVATVVARILTVIYFAFFFLMPWYTSIDKCKPEPDRVTM